MLAATLILAVICLPAPEPPQNLPPELAARALHLQGIIDDHRMAGRFDEALVVAHQRLALHRAAQGQEHWQAIDAHNQVVLLEHLQTRSPAEIAELTALTEPGKTAMQHMNAGSFDRALTLIKKQIDVRRRILGPDAPGTLRWMLILARLYKNTSRNSASEVLLRITLDGFARQAGADHPQTLSVKNSLAQVVHSQGRYEESERLFREVLDGRRRVLGSDDADTLGALHNLGMMLNSRGAHEEALRLVTAASESFERSHAGDHHIALIMMTSVARVTRDLGHLEEAETMFRSILMRRQAQLGDNNPLTSQMVHQLGLVRWDRGASDEAVDLLSRAAETHSRLMGLDHHLSLVMHNDLARIHFARGDLTSADLYWSRSAEGFETVRQRTSFQGFQRVQFAMDHTPYPGLAVCRAALARPEEAWFFLESNLARGLRDAVQRTAPSPPAAREDIQRDERRAIAQSLSDLDERISMLNDGHRAVERTLHERRRALEARLATLDQLDVGPSKVAADTVYPLERIRQVLHPDEAIVAWIAIESSASGLDATATTWACIVKHQGAPIWIPLTAEHDLPHRAGRMLARRPGGTQDRTTLLQTLAAQWLDPVHQHLREIRHVIVLPGALGAVPLEAISERFTVSYAPSATILTWLMQNPAAPRTHNLLAVADPVVRGDRNAALPALPGSGHEARAIARLFENNTSPVTVLLGSAASEAEIDTLSASEQLGRFSHLHFATHGVLDDRAPWRSALILTTPDRPTDVRALLEDQPIRDGRLTAAHIMNHWSLAADLVTLSGCGTALGTTGGGEGFVGFSQALFVAGARSLVLSLWQVDDKATTLLMQRFYENLLGAATTTRQVGIKTYNAGSPMPAFAALHEARQWLRSNRPQDNRRALAALGFDLTAAPSVTRGIKISNEQPRIPYDFSDAHYWAAFILIGDFR